MVQQPEPVWIADEKRVWELTQSPPAYYPPPPLQSISIPPSPMPLMSLDTHNPLHLERDDHGRRDFSHELTDVCAEPNECWTAACCPCTAYGETQANLHSLQRRNLPSTEDPTCNSSCFTYACISFFSLGFGSLFMACSQREEVRHRYGIHGSTYRDLCATLFCSICSMVQVKREVELETRLINRSLRHHQAAWE